MNDSLPVHTGLRILHQVAWQSKPITGRRYGGVQIRQPQREDAASQYTASAAGFEADSRAAPGPAQTSEKGQ